MQGLSSSYLTSTKNILTISQNPIQSRIGIFVWNRNLWSILYCHEVSYSAYLKILAGR